MKLKIYQKGLLFFIVPMSIQVLLLVGLLQLNQQLVESAKKIEVQARVQQNLVAIMLDFGTVWASIFNRAVGSDLQAERSLTAASAKERMNVNYDQLVEALKSERDSDTEKVAADLRYCIDLQSQALSELDQSISSDGVLQQYHKFILIRKTLKPVFFKVNHLRDLLDQKLQEKEKLLAEERAKKSVLQNMLYIAVLFDVLLALSTLWLFSKNITSRIALLTENAKALPTLEPLPSTVGGGDELAFLDRILHQTSKQLKEAVDVKNNLLNMIAHDIRTPISTARIGIENLTNNKIVTADAAANATVQRINRSLQLTHTLVEDLLLMQKQEMGKLELELTYFDLAKICSAVVEQVQPLAAGKNLEILNLIEEETFVVADSTRIFQVLQNYITNAIKFSPENKKIVVTSKIDGDVVRISVTDQGRGIAPRDLDKLFDQFSQIETSDSKMGSGLGLFICKSIIESHQGSVGADSRIGHGSTFWFELDLADED